MIYNLWKYNIKFKSKDWGKYLQEKEIKQLDFLSFIIWL